MSDNLTATAYHEAGHAVAAWWFDLPFEKASVIEDEDTLGRVNFTPPGNDFRPDIEVDARTQRRIEHTIVVALAGPLAGEKFSGATNETIAANDWETVIGLAEYVCGSPEQTEAYVEWLRVRASDLIEHPLFCARVERVADALVRDKELSARELRDLLVDQLPHDSHRA